MYETCPDVQYGVSLSRGGPRHHCASCAYNTGVQTLGAVHPLTIAPHGPFAASSSTLPLGDPRAPHAGALEGCGPVSEAAAVTGESRARENGGRPLLGISPECRGRHGLGDSEERRDPGLQLGEAVTQGPPAEAFWKPLCPHFDPMPLFCCSGPSKCNRPNPVICKGKSDPLLRPCPPRQPSPVSRAAWSVPFLADTGPRQCRWIRNVVNNLIFITTAC